MTPIQAVLSQKIQTQIKLNNRHKLRTTKNVPQILILQEFLKA